MYKILIIEPYFGGSHRFFLKSLQENINAEFTFLTLPARKWKMRMQLSAPWFVRCIENMENRKFDTVLCSTFVDVAVFRTLLDGITGWNEKCLYCTYFHENQFVYPVREEEKAQHQFATINYNTALASDRIAFNSQYNMKTFMEGCGKYINKAADMDLKHTLVEIERKAIVLYPGIDSGGITNFEKEINPVPVICWNHRWEHDKNPDEFFYSLADVDESGYDFKLVVLGQAYSDVPPVFDWALKRFNKKILHFGYISSRDEYLKWLKKCDIVVSTAFHEFFGISVMEAVNGGCIPLVPDRLSYPELYPQSYRYKEGEFTAKLTELLDDFSHGKLSPINIDINRFSWDSMQHDYSTWLMKNIY